MTLAGSRLLFLFRMGHLDSKCRTSVLLCQSLSCDLTARGKSEIQSFLRLLALTLPTGLVVLRKSEFHSAWKSR